MRRRRQSGCSLSTSGDRNPRLQAKRRIGEVASCDDTAAAVARCAFSVCPVWAPKHRIPVVSGTITRRRSGGRGRWSISNRPLLNPSPCRRGSFSEELERRAKALGINQSSSINLTKQAVAKRHIEAAITFLFSGGDPISIYTIAAASTCILRDLL